jgi:hypothetical protein
MEVPVLKQSQSITILALSVALCAAFGQASIFTEMRKPDQPVTGLPYSADQTVRTKQMLANGTVLTHEFKGHVCRSTNGVERIEGIPQVVSPSGHDPAPQVYILDRAKHTGVSLNTQLKTAVVDHFPSDSTVTVSFLPIQQFDTQDHLIKPENSITTDLGQQVQDGLKLVGKHMVSTIPMGTVGNDQKLEITIDTWMAPELKLVVNQAERNPLAGERSLELRNIVRGEPDAALFLIPEGYRVSDRPMPPSTAPPVPLP